MLVGVTTNLSGGGRSGNIGRNPAVVPRESEVPSCALQVAWLTLFSSQNHFSSSDYETRQTSEITCMPPFSQPGSCGLWQRAEMGREMQQECAICYAFFKKKEKKKQEKKIHPSPKGNPWLYCLRFYTVDPLEERGGG